MKRRSFIKIYGTATALYILGIWLHIPYGGGNVYSDIVTVFQQVECPNSICSLLIPYIQVSSGYPVLTSIFMYTMGKLGSLFSGDLLSNYYYLSCIFLAIPTFLLIRELLIVAEILIVKSKERKIILYLLATPTFIFLLLVNWYVIGVYFTVYGFRKFLQGSRILSGALLGVSAAANLVTALPGLGMFLKAGRRAKIVFVASTGITYALINLPFIALGSSGWLYFLNRHYTQHVEGSWMLAFFDRTSTIPREIFPFLFVELSLFILLTYVQKRDQFDKMIRGGLVQLSWMFTFAFMFSTYVFTPQMNLILLPFFAVTRIVRYWEFIAFEIVSSLIIIIGFSQILQVFGITYYVIPFGFSSPVQWLAIVRSLWVGKMLLFNGIIPFYRNRLPILATPSRSHAESGSPRPVESGVQ